MKSTQAHVIALIQYTAKPTAAHRAIDLLVEWLPGPESTPSAIKQVYQQNKSLEDKCVAPEILVLGRRKQEDQEFKASLVYKRPCLKNKQVNTQTNKQSNHTQHTVWHTLIT